MSEKTAPASAREPEIIHKRTLKLRAQGSARGRLTLGHLSQFVAEAKTRGYGDDAHVSVLDSPPAFDDDSGVAAIMVGDDK